MGRNSSFKKNVVPKRAKINICLNIRWGNFNNPCPFALASKIAWSEWKLTWPLAAEIKLPIYFRRTQVLFSFRSDVWHRIVSIPKYWRLQMQVCISRNRRFFHLWKVSGSWRCEERENFLNSICREFETKMYFTYFCLPFSRNCSFDIFSQLLRKKNHWTERNA